MSRLYGVIMDDGTRAEILMDHYKDTFQNILYHWQARNRLFVYMLILLAGICVDLYHPGFFSHLANSYVQKQGAAEAAAGSAHASGIPLLDLRVVGLIAWFSLLCLVISYYQRSIHVDRQYNYIAKVEDDLNQVFGADLITREGKGYQSCGGVLDAAKSSRRPMFLRAIGYVYTAFVPIGLIALGIWKLCSELQHAGAPWGFFLLNLFVAVALIAYNAFYMVWRFGNA